MQELRDSDFPDEEFLRKFYTGDSLAAIEKAMDADVGPTQEVVRCVKLGRNSPCPCGSGKKFKKCCIHLAEKV